MKIAHVVPVLAMLAFSSVARGADPKVGFIDKDRIMAESAIGKRTIADLVSFKAERRQRVSAAASAAERARGTKDWDAKLQAANSAVEQANQESDAHARELDVAVMREVRAIAKKLAEQQKLDLVDFASHVYARNDLTDAVIARLDAESYEAITKLTAAKAAAEARLEAKETAPAGPAAKAGDGRKN